MNLSERSLDKMNKIRFILPLVFILSAMLLWSCNQNTEPDFGIKVEAEEIVYEYESANNGAGPMWCHGNTCIVRFGDHVVVSGLETLGDLEPLHNTRWMLFERTDKGWEMLLKDEKGRTREPSPLGLINDGKILLSVNPTLTEPGSYDGPAEPQILQFDAKDISATYDTLKPDWEGNPEFTEHSYRSFAVDGPANELILFQNIGYSHAEWSFLDGDGNWRSQGKLTWPWEDDYGVPRAVRVCYPVVQLKDREVHFLGVSDIIEPNNTWKDYTKNFFRMKNRAMPSTTPSLKMERSFFVSPLC